MAETQKKDGLEEILRAWAADRENVSRLAISDVSFDYDEGFHGTDVTPPEWPECVVKYTVKKDIIFRVDVRDLGRFVHELAKVASRGPL